jgi:methylated-DNA-[protein]-cysteine S-methyltransferase
MTDLYFISYTSPVGNLNLFASSLGLKRIEFCPEPLSRKTSLLLENTALQLDEYFSGKRMEFELPLDAEGTSFQKSVWKELLAIPFGSTRSYQDLAKAIEKPKASRAVGQANNRNPLAIVVPCHRVIGKDLSLVGYAGGLPLKKWLLEHEAKHL